MTDFPDIKIKTLVSFPAAVNGGAGLAIQQINGQYYFSLDYSGFAVVSSLPLATAPNNYTLSYDIVQKSYLLIPSSGNRASFSANVTVAQNFPASGTWVKVSYTAMDYNTGNFYDLTNLWWRPPAGKARFTASLFIQTGAVDQAQSYLALYKNGALFRVLCGPTQSGTLGFVMEGAVSDLASGSDYYEIWGSVGGAGIATSGTSGVSNYFQGEMVA